MFLNVSCSTTDDLISVENSVSFFKDKLNSNQTSIEFKIKVSNQSKNPIPDLGVMNRSKFLFEWKCGQSYATFQRFRSYQP
ncbi:hypothetical protein LEP1GSC072_3493 [Leptospira noguchii str. Bonito]|nr:hypothetical protein LEP1GSC072_3493 [Leptospira noguchii str. Bonito]